MNASAPQISTNPTPILDRQAPLPAPAKPGFWTQVPSLIALVTLLYILPFLLITGRGRLLDPLRHWIVSNGRTLFDEWAGIRLILTGFAIVLACLAAVAVHEFGHLVVGIGMGFRFESVQVGRTQIDSSFRVVRVPAADEPRLGGVHFLPDEMKHRPWRCFLMILAGPVANLIVAFAVMSLPFHKSFVSGAFIFMCLVLGVVNLFPSASDGRDLATLLMRRANFEARLALAQLYEQVRAGVQLEALSPALIAEAASLREKSIRTAVVQLIGYSAAYSQHKDQEAAQLLETGLQYSNYAAPSLKEELIANAAIFQAGRRKRIDLAEQWLALLPVKPAALRKRLMVEGAILEAQEDYLGALKKVEEIEKDIVAKVESARQESALRPFAKWKVELEQKAASATAHPAPSS